MDIKGFGAVYVHDLIAEGYLKDVADIFTLSQYREELIQKGIVGKVKTRINSWLPSKRPNRTRRTGF